MTRRTPSRASGALRLLPGGRGHPGGIDKHVLVRRAEQILDLRQRRVREFGATMFGEPAWDILLSAYVGDRHHDRLTIAHLTGIAGVSLSTALRWLNYLVGEGLVERHVHPAQSGQMIVQLTDRSRETLERYLAGTFAEWPA